MRPRGNEALIRASIGIARRVGRRRYAKTLLERGAEGCRAFITHRTRHCVDAFPFREQRQRSEHAALPPPRSKTQTGFVEKQPLKGAQAGAANFQCNDVERARVSRCELVADLVYALTLTMSAAACLDHESRHG
jgi:hypothetical protein